MWTPEKIRKTVAQINLDHAQQALNSALKEFERNPNGKIQGVLFRDEIKRLEKKVEHYADQIMEIELLGLWEEDNGG